jgi:CRISPR-associated protein Cas1
MGTLYIIQNDAFIGKIDERLHVKANKQTLQDVPLIQLDAVVVMGRATISPAAAIELLERKIPLTFLTENGKYLGKLEPELTKNIFLRAAQWQAAGASAKAVHLVRGFVRGKLKNYRIALQRTHRKYPELPLESAIIHLENAISPIDKTDNINSLRGLEGTGSGAYFGAFKHLIHVDGFSFKARNRRPPTDPVNALLSFGYSLLRHDIQSAVNIVGFDPYLGYLHFQHYGRPGLALDLMEEFRPLVVDSMVLSAINLRQIKPADFTIEPLSNAVLLSEEGRKEFLKLYAQKKQSKITHPVLGKKLTYQETFEIQARFMGKYLMGEVDQYPPLVLR